MHSRSSRSERRAETALLSDGASDTCTSTNSLRWRYPDRLYDHDVLGILDVQMQAEPKLPSKG